MTTEETEIALKLIKKYFGDDYHNLSSNVSPLTVVRVMEEYASMKLKEAQGEVMMPTDEVIAKMWAKVHNVSEDEEEDIYDAVRCKIWMDGAKWIRDNFLTEQSKDRGNPPSSLKWTDEDMKMFGSYIHARQFSSSNHEDHFKDFIRTYKPDNK